MNRIRRVFFIVIAIIVFIGFNNVYYKVNAYDDINIISSTNVTQGEAENWARSKGATETFVSLASLYWTNASSCGGVNPAVAYVQAALETGYGKFSGVINDSYCNPCGFKVSSGGGDYDPNAHKRFNSWTEGVQAHLDHLALYASAAGYPRSNTYDPRHFPYLSGKATTVLSLSNNWAAGQYGNKVLKLYNDLLAFSGKNPSNTSSYSTAIETTNNVPTVEVTNIEDVEEQIQEEKIEEEDEIIVEKLLIAECLKNDNKKVSQINIYVDDEVKAIVTDGLSDTSVYDSYYNQDENVYNNALETSDLMEIAQGKKKIMIEKVFEDGKKSTTIRKLNIEMILSNKVS